MTGTVKKRERMQTTNIRNEGGVYHHRASGHKKYNKESNEQLYAKKNTI